MFFRFHTKHSKNDERTKYTLRCFEKLQSQTFHAFLWNISRMEDGNVGSCVAISIVQCNRSKTMRKCATYLRSSFLIALTTLGLFSSSSSEWKNFSMSTEFSLFAECFTFIRVQISSWKAEKHLSSRKKFVASFNFPPSFCRWTRRDGISLKQ
jgi:hypothetical protein